MPFCYCVAHQQPLFAYPNSATIYHIATYYNSPGLQQPSSIFILSLNIFVFRKYSDHD